MPTLTIDGRTVTVPDGATIKDAAETLGIRIPTLCYLPERAEQHAACMVCAVKVDGRPHLVPSCSTPAAEGMIVACDTDEVREHRRKILELILSDHLGDCEAPCELTCPAGMEIPAMMRHVAAGDVEEAIRVVKREIALPATLGRVCPEICEKACRRKDVDSPLAICQVKRYVGDYGARGDVAATAALSPRGEPTGKRVAVVGAGPAGLAAAFYLAGDGHAVTLLEAQAEAGGHLRADEELLPRAIYDAEIGVVLGMVGEWRPGVSLGRDVGLAALERDFDAVVLACGTQDEETVTGWGLAARKGRPAVTMKTLATERPGVFAAGMLVRNNRVAVRMVADGKLAAVSVGQYLRGKEVVGVRKRFNSRTGRLEPAEIEYLVPGEMDPAERNPGPPPPTRFGDPAAAAEARRCLHCDCVARGDCELRRLAEEYGAKQNAYAGTRRPLRRIQVGSEVVFEPGKCITCGRCVYLCQAAGEDIGLAFAHRGFEIEVTPAFGRTLDEALRAVAARCIAACPTGALSWRRDYGPLRAPRDDDGEGGGFEREKAEGGRAEG